MMRLLVREFLNELSVITPHQIELLMNPDPVQESGTLVVVSLREPESMRFVLKKIKPGLSYLNQVIRR